ncbi:ABC transporter ATP-binding protein [Methylobacillus sp. MM3]|uniref:ABC transporter ATP-binding protein n=1 Tax=Methylobacillus sp. MM3 TaxID=1848039 RepID=UPI000B496D56|nr:ABC transporter ATP-binding protein [Methylobacillus sp. MM3]
MSVAIKVENLSKQYQLRHQKQQRYVALRDVITNKAASAWRGIREIGKTKSISADLTRETFWALKDINLEIEQGDRIGIIGRNGAGKSTLLKLLSRIIEPTTGKISINGRISSLLEVGTGFHPELTGRENVYLNGAILGMRHNEIKRKFDQIVAFADVERFLDTPVKHYSSGMYMRLAFSVAAHLDPEILVVDEVLAVGDAQFQKKCLGKMKEVGSEGRTVLFVSHNMDAITAFCNRGVVLGQGEVIFDGDVARARSEYLRQSTSKHVSVENNSGRGGSGGVNVEWVGVETPEGGPKNEILVGDSLRVGLKASVADELRTRKDIQVAFGIDSEDGTRHFTFLSSWIDFTLDVSAGSINLQWYIESVPLVPGRYLISATVLFQGETLDSVQHCAEFRVSVPQKHMHIERLQGWGVLDLSCKIFNR